MAISYYSVIDNTKMEGDGLEFYSFFAKYGILKNDKGGRVMD